jgi:hypothetical protein
LLCAGCEANAVVWRVGGADRDTVEPFPVYAPKIIAHIGEPDDLLADRSIVIRMERKRPTDEIAKWRSRAVAGEGAVLAGRLARWSADHGETLGQLYDSMEPFDLANDRAAEMWLPPLAVVQAADPEAADDLLAAAKELTSGDTDADGVRIQLLAAIREVFTEAGADFMPTETLLERLHARADEPWSTWGRQSKAMTAHALAGQLRRFLIYSQHSADRSTRGYAQAAFTAAWDRYLRVTTSENTAKT